MLNEILSAPTTAIIEIFYPSFELCFSVQKTEAVLICSTEYASLLASHISSSVSMLSPDRILDFGFTLMDYTLMWQTWHRPKPLYSCHSRALFVLLLHVYIHLTIDNFPFGAHISVNGFFKTRADIPKTVTFEFRVTSHDCCQAT